MLHMHRCSSTEALTRPVHFSAPCLDCRGESAMLFWVFRLAGCLHDVCGVVSESKKLNHSKLSCCMRRHTVTTRSACMLLPASPETLLLLLQLLGHGLVCVFSSPHLSVLTRPSCSPSQIVFSCPKPARCRRTKFMQISFLRRDFT